MGTHSFLQLYIYMYKSKLLVIDHIVVILGKLQVYIYIYIYIYSQRITMCPHGYHHNGFMATPAYIYTKILEVNLFAFAYRLLRRDFSPLNGSVPSTGASHSTGATGEISTKQSVGKCKQINF